MSRHACRLRIPARRAGRLVAAGKRSATRGLVRQQKTRGGKPFGHLRYRNRHGTVAEAVTQTILRTLCGEAMPKPNLLFYRRTYGFGDAV